jgi:hypothetical protein
MSNSAVFEKIIFRVQEWFEKTAGPINEWSSIIWAIFNTVGTSATVLGIYKIMKTLQ